MNAKYLIHVYAPRRWYVDEFLIPSMIEQGIKQENIDIFCDDGTYGNLNACMMSFEQMGDTGATWHLQDDILISHDFKDVTESFANDDETVVCGYCYERDTYKRTGSVDPVHMWFSFPCILIPNRLASGCAKWFYDEGRFDCRYQHWIQANKFDDSAFRTYMVQFNTYWHCVNLDPNIVDHVDYLIGGSIVNKEREKRYPQSRALYFKDQYLVDQLEKRLEDRNGVQRNEEQGG